MKFVSRSLELRRVVVTGLGVISPAGMTVEENWEKIRNGESCIDKITKFDASEYYSQIAGEIKGYDPLDFFDRKEVRKYDAFVQYSLVAAGNAVKDAELNLNKINLDRSGVYIGSGIGGIQTIENNKQLLLEKGPRRVSPFFIPSSIANIGSGQVSIKYGLRGPNLANVTACATSTHSIGDSFKIIQRGEADLMLAGGAEAPITPLAIAGFSIIRALSARNDDPKTASRPFDKDRDGFVAAEGSAVLVLEDLEHAIKRGARIYGEIVGYGYTGDAYHMTAPDPEAGGAIRSMKMAINDAHISLDQIDYINAHGTSTPFNDKTESKAIRDLFKEKADDLLISSTKSMIGHMLGATGGAEAAFTLLSIYHSFVPPTINYYNQDEECDLNYVPNKGVAKDLEYAISNSFGFGGTNGTLAFKKFDNK
jgi:3-oxoacyl-[acyl-carrier-protein] synthase II